MYFVRDKLYNTLKFLNRRLSLRCKIICLVVIILLVAALVYDLFVKISVLFKQQPYPIILGFVLLSLSIFLLWRNKNIPQKRIIPTERPLKIYALGRNTKNHQSIIDTKGGNYNENVQGNYYEGDCINHHVNIQERKVEVGSDISYTLDEFRKILAQMIFQNSNPIESISKFAQELAEELRKYPELKSYFNADKDSDEKELTDIILKLILAQSFSSQSFPSQKLNNTDNLSWTYWEEEEEEEEEEKQERQRDRYVLYYKGYAIDVTIDHNDSWYYKIQDAIDFNLKTTKNIYFNASPFSFKENAITAAKKKIDERRFNNWKNNMR